VTPEELAAAIRTVLEEASAEGSLALPAAEIPDPRVERPRNRDHGDWSTNVAMQLAKKAGTKPRDLAELLVPRLEALDGIASVEVAGPGFLNIRLDAASAGELARSIVEAGQARQQERLLPHGQGPGRPGVDENAPVGLGGVGHPQPAAGAVGTGGLEPGAQVCGNLFLAQERCGVVSPGDEGGGSRGAGDGGGLELGGHAAGSHEGAAS